MWLDREVPAPSHWGSLYLVSSTGMDDCPIGFGRRRIEVETGIKHKKVDFLLVSFSGLQCTDLRAVGILE